MPLIASIGKLLGKRAKAMPKVSGEKDPATNRKSFIQYSGYDAVKAKGRRQAPTGLVRDEDKELPPSSRRMAVSGTRDLVRNISVVMWMIRKHLDYTSSFRFKSATGNEELDARIEELIEWAGRKENYDIAGRHSLSRSMRMAEARCTVDGDIFELKLNDGHVQWIEGDRIRTPYAGLPQSIDISRVNHGVITDGNGKAIAYVLCRRAITSDAGYFGQEMQYDRTLRAAWVYHHACWDLCRFDQVRGNSPLLSALNSFRDVYEEIDLALAKSKIAQMFGIAIYRDAAPDTEALGAVTRTDVVAEDGASGDETGETETHEEEGPRYKLDMGRGPFLLDLNDNDKAGVLEAATPSTEFQTFIPLVLQLALKSLDIPFSFYDEAYTNYSGQKQAFVLYEKSAEGKRQNNRDMLNDWTRWRLGLFVDDGVLDLAKYGMQVRDLKFEWRHTGTPWLDQLKEVVGSIAAIEAGLESPISVIEETTGRAYTDVLADRKKYLDEFKRLGMDPPTWATTPKEALQSDTPEGGQAGESGDTSGKQKKNANGGKRTSAAFDLALAMACAERPEPKPKKETANV